jgi:hypothetical protein
MRTILHLSRGGVAGLELLTTYRKYKYNLVTSREFTVLLKIPLNFINDTCIDEKKNLMKLYLNQEKVINENLGKFEKLYIKNKEPKDEDKQFQHMIEETTKVVVKENPNEFKEMNILINKVDKNLYFRHVTPLKENKTVSVFRTSSQTKVERVEEKPNSIYLTLSNYKKNVCNRKTKVTTLQKSPSGLNTHINTMNINKTITKFKTTNQKKQVSYDTGRFDLPLIFSYLNG